MGGLDSGISDDTHTIIFESAKFARDNVRRTSRKLNLKSDSSARFEKASTFESGNRNRPRFDAHSDKRLGHDYFRYDRHEYERGQPRTLTVQYKKINNILGIKVPTEKWLRF